METRTPKFKKGQRVIITLINDRKRWEEAEVTGIVGGQYGNLTRYIVRFDNGSTAIEYEEDLIKADMKERRNKRLCFTED